MDQWSCPRCRKAHHASVPACPDRPAGASLLPIGSGPFDNAVEREYGYRNGRQLSHYLIDVTARGREALEHALAVVFTDLVSGRLRATHYTINHQHGLVLMHCLHRSPPEEAVAFAEPLERAEATEAVWQWLADSRYSPDEHDGAVAFGFRVYNETFGIVGDWWGAFAAIRPTLIYIPK